jgi:DNA invertase Pin-like site-specific DNA recombinase
MDRMEEGSLLFVAKLGREGRNAMDVHARVERLAASGVRAHWFARVTEHYVRERKGDKVNPTK